MNAKDYSILLGDKSFVLSIGHDLKTPLTSVKGFAQLLLDKRGNFNNEEKEYYIRLIHKNAERLQKAVIEIEDLFLNQNIEICKEQR